MEIVPLALGPSFLTDMGCSKKVSFGIFRLPRIGKVIEKVIDKIIDKVLSWTVEIILIPFVIDGRVDLIFV